VLVPGAAGAIDIAAGAMNTCARFSDGSMKCWGANDGGQVGDGTVIQRDAPVTVLGISSAAGLMSGPASFLACALLTDASVSCWGQVATFSAFDPAPSGVAEIVNALGMGCIRTLDGGLKCFGNNANGEVGDGTNTERTTFTPVLW
jgi:hypothetical protein